MAFRKFFGQRANQPRRRRSFAIGRGFESLESRRLLTADPWQDSANHLDVNGDNHVNALDALKIIQALNDGITKLPNLNSAPEMVHVAAASTSGLQNFSTASSSTVEALTPQNFGYLDVSGSGTLTGLDALLIIQALNVSPSIGTPDMSNTLETVDATGAPITSIPVGGTFYLEDVVQDLRPSATGVEQSYSDVTYDSSLASVSSTITYGTTFTNNQAGDFSTAGEINDIGAAQSAPPSPTNSQQVLWSTPVTATATGALTFTNAADPDTTDFPTLLFPGTSDEPSANINFQNATITVVPADMSNTLIAVSSPGGAPLPNSTIEPGGLFYLEDVVQDLRGAEATGVAQSYSDVTYNSSLASISPSSVPTFTTFTENTNYDLSTPGEINDIGAGQDTPPDPLTSQQVLWSVPVVASAAGVLTFTNAADPDTTDYPNQLFPATSDEPNANVLFQSVTVQVVQAALSIDNVTVPEPAADGTITATFAVSLNAPISQTVTVAYATQDNTALQNVDYIPESGTLTFAPNGNLPPAAQFVSVPILANSNFSGNANFFVNLTSPTPPGTPILAAQGIGTISNSVGTLAISNENYVEDGTGNPITQNFVVTLSSASTQTITVNYATADQSALAGTNYVAASGTLTFAPGVTTQTIPVTVDQTGITMPVSFVVDLSDAVNSYITGSEGIGTIYPEGSAPTGANANISLTVTDTSGNVITKATPGTPFDIVVDVQDLRSVTDGGIFSAYLNLGWNSATATQDGPIIFGSNFSFDEANGTQTPGSIVDMGAIATNPADPPTVPYPNGAVQELLVVPMISNTVGVLTFTATPSTTGINDPGAGDDVLEYNNPSSPLLVTATPTPAGSNVYGQVSFGSVSVPDGANGLTIAGPPAPINVPTSGTTTATFTVTLGLPSGTLPISVNYATVNGTAIAGTDYTAASGVLTFDPSGFGNNPDTQTITVTVLGNPLNEPNKTFSIVLTNPTNGATILTATATATLQSTAPEPIIVATTSSVNEGSTATVTVSLIGAGGLPLSSGQTITVAYSTANGTALAGTDYTATSGTLTFLPGVTSQTISIPTIYDPASTGSKTFTVNFTNPTNATLGTSAVTVTIAYVAPASISGYVYVDSNNDGIKESNELGIAGVTVTLTQTAGGSATATTTTNSAGFYSFSNIQPGTYSVTETQPGFYAPGKNTAGTPAPTGATVGNTFNGIVIASGVSATNYDFGELGLRAQFVSAYLNRRAFIASSIITSEYGTPVVLNNFNLQQGDVYISFDNAWSGLRTIEALYTASAGTVTLTLYDNNFNVLATSGNSVPATLSYSGTTGSAYFLKISGTNTDVNLQITGGTVAGVTPALSSASSNSGSSSSSSGSGTASLFAAASGSSSGSSTTSTATTTSQVAVAATTAPATTTKPKSTSTTDTAATDAALGQTSVWAGTFFA